MIIILLILILSTNFLQATPLEKIYFKIQGVYLICIAIFTFLYIISRLKNRGKINRYILIYTIIVLFAIIYPAYRAHNVFGQPYIYGILAQRKWFLIGTPFLFYHLLNKNKISFNFLEKNFIFLSWICLIGFTILYIFLLTHPIRFDTSEQFSRFTQDRGLRLHVNNYFITLGIIYYFIKSQIKKEKSSLIYFLCFFAYILLVNKGRTYILYLLITYFLFILSYFPTKRKILKFTEISLVIIILVTGISFAFPEYVSKMSFLFEQMFKVIQGSLTDDPSSNARIFQTLTVFKFFSLHPETILLGVGKLSHQWNDGFNGLFGYFYPSDIGLIGVLFLYGIVGTTIVYIIPAILSIKLIFNIKDRKEKNLFTLTLKYLLLFILISSITTGNIVFNPYTHTIPYFILYAYLSKKRGTYSNEQES